MKLVEQQAQSSVSRTLFHDHFHMSKTAQHLEGQWFAKWTEQKPDGTEDVFEIDSLQIWSTEGRIRMVGLGMKGEPYPMEGVISSQGVIALSYWSKGEIPICGILLLESWSRALRYFPQLGDPVLAACTA